MKKEIGKHGWAKSEISGKKRAKKEKDRNDVSIQIGKTESESSCLLCQHGRAVWSVDCGRHFSPKKKSLFFSSFFPFIQWPIKPFFLSQINEMGFLEFWICCNGWGHQIMWNTLFILIYVYFLSWNILFSSFNSLLKLYIMPSTFTPSTTLCRIIQPEY